MSHNLSQHCRTIILRATAVHNKIGGRSSGPAAYLSTAARSATIERLFLQFAVLPKLRKQAGAVD